jgi:hypothetical protein
MRTTPTVVGALSFVQRAKPDLLVGKNPDEYF